MDLVGTCLLSPSLKECLRSLAWNAAENPEEKQREGKGERVIGKGKPDLLFSLYPDPYPIGYSSLSTFFLLDFFEIRNSQFDIGHVPFQKHPIPN